MKFALISNNKVVEVRDVASESDLPPDLRAYQAVMEVTDMDPQPEAGWDFLGTTLTDPSGELTPSKIMSKLKFLERFTEEELGRIEAFAAQSNPYAYALRAAIRKQQVAEFIDLSLAQTIAGVNNLGALGLLAPERVGQILNTPLREEEKYKERS